MMRVDMVSAAFDFVLVANVYMLLSLSRMLTHAEKVNPRYSF